MKTLIIAFWSPHPVSGGESKVFRLNNSMVKLLQEEKVYMACFKEESFKFHEKFTKDSKVLFIKEFVFEQFLFTKCQTMLLVIDENLKKSFLKLIGYHKATQKKSAPAPSIPGHVFGDDDNIFIYLQDKSNLGFFPKQCLAGRYGKNDEVRLKIFGHFKSN